MKKLLKTLALILVSLLLTACGSTKVELAPYLSVSYTGYNGNGTAHVDFDFADFEYGIMSQWKDKEKNWEKLAELTAVETTVTYAADVSEGLRNGDTVTVKIELNEEKAKEYGYSFTGLEKKFTVEGLPEPVMVDPFDESVLKLSVQGISPFAYMDILYVGSKSEPQAHITYKADKQYDLKNGDTVTVTAAMSDHYTQQGYLLTREELTLTVEGLQSYVTDVASLSSDDLAALRSKVSEYYDTKISEGWLNLNIGGSQKSLARENIGSVGELRFADTGYAVAQNGWGVTAAVILPFKVDVNDAVFHWWNNDYYEEPLIKSFADLSGYFVITDLLLDENGQLIREGSFGMEMSDFYENEQQMVAAVTARYSSGTLCEGTFAG